MPKPFSNRPGNGMHMHLSLNDGVRKREVFGWAMYDFANSGYTTVVLTAVFNAYFVAAVAGNADDRTLADIWHNGALPINDRPAPSGATRVEA